MAGWYTARTVNRSTTAVIAMMLLAVVLVATAPLALLVGVAVMLMGHVIGGLALLGGSILAAMAAVILAGLIGVRHLRTLVSQRSFRILQLDSDDYTYLS
jgi:uncharacterized membrane protein YdjX (TVP38/TMEM64 family)